MPVATLLPFTATPSRKSASPTSFRLTEKFILLLVFSAFITLCFGAIFFLPDSSKLLSGVFFHSSAVETNTRTGTDSDSNVAVGTEEKILTKIRKDHEKALVEAKDTLQKRPDEIKQDIQDEKDKVLKEGKGGKDYNNLPVIEYVRPPGATGHEPSDPETKERRAKIKEMMTFAWDSYKRYAWGSNELRPVSKQGHSSNLFGSIKGATIVDALDTLYIMEMFEDFDMATEWVEKNLDFNVSAVPTCFKMFTIVPVPKKAKIIALHTALSHLDKRNTYVRMLFIDYSSAFNSIVPSKLIIKLRAMGLNPTLCNWILDFLNTGTPQGCVFSPLLYSLFTHDCVATHSSNSIIKFADNATVVGLITNNDETANREEMRALGEWCQESNLSLNVNKTQELIVDFRKQQGEHSPIHIDGTGVEKVESFKFLGVHITDCPPTQTV